MSTSTKNAHLSAMTIYPKSYALRRATSLHAHTCVPHAKQTHTRIRTDDSDTPPSGGGCGAHLWKRELAAQHTAWPHLATSADKFQCARCYWTKWLVECLVSHEASSSCLAPTNAEREWRESFESESESECFCLQVVTVNCRK